MQWILNRFFHMTVFCWNQRTDTAGKKSSEINISVSLNTEELNEVANQNMHVYAYTLVTDRKWRLQWKGVDVEYSRVQNMDKYRIWTKYCLIQNMHKILTM